MTKSYRLLGADGRLHSSSSKGLLGGNSRGKIYGRLDCPSALRAVKRGRTYQQHRVFFADEPTAVAAGYRPCAVCMRDAYKKWRARQHSNSNVAHVDEAIGEAQEGDGRCPS